MGFFSFRTQDTDRSIPNCYCGRPQFSVTMRDDKGNKWTENKYEGYGKFGGKLIYDLAAEMNGYEEYHYSDLKIYTVWPTLTEDPDAVVDNSAEPPNCEFQGHFY